MSRPYIPVRVLRDTPEHPTRAHEWVGTVRVNPESGGVHSPGAMPGDVLRAIRAQGVEGAIGEYRWHRDEE